MFETPLMIKTDVLYDRRQPGERVDECVRAGAVVLRGSEHGVTQRILSLLRVVCHEPQSLPAQMFLMLQPDLPERVRCRWAMGGFPIRSWRCIFFRKEFRRN